MFATDLESLFEAYRTRGDLRALGQLFDTAAPQLYRLARHLARGRDDSEDMVQATFVTAIERATTFDAQRPVLPWLAGILALHAHKARERAGRASELGERELASADDPTHRAAANELADAVARAVEELPSNYAGFVRRHLVDGARAGELAREFGVSEVNARTRLHRGLKLLRRTLPAGIGASSLASPLDARSLAKMRHAVLARAIELTGAALPSASSSLGLVTVGIFGLALLSAWLVVRAASRTDDSSATLATVLGAAETDARVESGAVSSRASSVEDSAMVRATPGAAADGSSASTFAAQTSSDVNLRGVILLPDGSPAAGASVVIRGWPANEQQIERFGLPESWSAPAESFTDSAGRFDVSFESPQAYQFTLTATKSGFVPAGWRWHQLPLGEVVDVGERRLELAGTLVVKLVDGAGQALCSPWRAAFSEADGAHTNDREPIHVGASCDPATGEFRCTTLPSGRIDVRMTSPLGASVVGHAQCVAGSTTELTLAYDGPDLARRIAVKLRDQHLRRSFPPAPNTLVLRGGGIERRDFGGGDPQLTGVVFFDGVDSGNYEVALEDPRFEAQLASDVAPGTLTTIELRPVSGVRIHLTDAQGATLDLPFSVEASWMESVEWEPGITSQSASSTWLRTRGEPAPADGVYRFVSGVAANWKVRVVQGPSLDIALAPLAVGEVREITSVVDVSRSVSGRVLATDGVTPVPGVTIELTRGEVPGFGDSNGRSISGVHQPPVERSTTSDATGSFAFDALTPETWTLRAKWGPYLVADRTLEATSGATTVELVEPQSGRLRGRLLVPEGASFAERGICAWPPPQLLLPFEALIDVEPSALRADGTFDLGPFPLATINLTLACFEEYPDGRAMTGIDLGSFPVVPGSPPPLEIDLRERFPATVRAQCTQDGQPAASLFVQLERVADGRPSGRTSLADGSCTLTNAPLGVVRVVVRDRDQLWQTCLPQTIALAPAADVPLAIDVTTFERDVLVLDAATNAPLAGFELALFTGACSREFQATRTTDSQGRLRVRIPGIDVRFGAASEPAAVVTPAQVSWVAGAEPLVLRVAR